MTRERHDTHALNKAFAERYGPWALVAGASEGLGAAFARALAARGLNVVMVARRAGLLERVAQEVRQEHGVEVRPMPGDLAAREFVERVQEECARLPLGLFVYNACEAPVGDLADADTGELMRVVDVNVRAPVLLLRGLLPAMIARGRGGVVLMTSMAGNQGSPRLAAYSASKAFARELAEGLWYELKPSGVDLVACCAGAIRTPGYAAAAGKDALGTLDPEQVAAQALHALGRGPVVIPGAFNRIAAVLMTRLLPRRKAIAVMAGSTSGLVPANKNEGGT
jgi:short-subunit dehydrogenase